jgi:tetratricopeptide (TPR) repeat protein
LMADYSRDMTGALAALREGNERFRGDPVIVNNLAYVYLMQGDARNARLVLESTEINSVEAFKVPLIATWGLLYLWEGEIEKGRSEYRKAEELAVREGNKRLSRIVTQKMHLELARAYGRRGDIERAEMEVSGGLAINERSPYREDLLLLNGILMRRREKGRH